MSLQLVYNIKKWVPKNMNADRAMLITGRPGLGKSFLIEDISYHNRKKFDVAVAMSVTRESRDMFAKFIPRSCIYEKYEEDVIVNLVKICHQAEKEGTLISVLIILDDLMYEKAFLKTAAMRDIHQNGRHFNICFMNVAQYAVDVPKDIRCVLNYVIVFREQAEKVRKILYENFFTIMSEEAFNLALDVFCKNKGDCLVFDGTAEEGGIENQIFWYKASAHEPFQVGARDFWKCHYKSFNPAPQIIERKIVLKSLIDSSDSQKEKLEDVAPVVTPRTRAGKSRKNKGVTITVQKAEEDGRIVAKVQPLTPKKSTHNK